MGLRLQRGVQVDDAGSAAVPGAATRSSVSPGTRSRTASAFGQMSSAGCGPSATRMRAPAAWSSAAIASGCSRKLIGTALPAVSAPHSTAWVSTRLGSM